MDYFSLDHFSSNVKARALRGASVTLSAQACNYVITTAGTIILARLLTPNDFGLVAMVLTFSMLLQNFGSNGFIEAIIQKKEISHRQVSTLFWINAGLSLILMLLFMISASAIAWFYQEPLLKPIVVVMSGSILLAGLANQHQALLRRNMEFYKTSVNEIVATLVSLAISIAMAFGGWRYWALVAKWIVSPLLITTGSWVMCRWRPGLPSRDAEVNPMLKFAFNTYGNFVLGYFRRTVDKILIGRFLGSQSLGSYDRAFQLSNALPNQMLGPLNSVVMASFSRLTENPENYRHSYLSLLSSLAFVCMPLSGALTLTGNDLILLLLGSQWKSAGPIFIAFGLSIGIFILYYTHAWLHLSLGTPEKWIRWGIIAFTVSVLFVSGGMLYGPLGVAIGYSTSLYILIIPGLWYAGRPVDLRISSIVLAIWKFFVSAFVAGSICWLALYKIDLSSNIFAELNSYFRIGVCSVIFMLLYLPMVVILYGGIKPISGFVSLLLEMVPRRSSGKQIN